MQQKCKLVNEPTLCLSKSYVQFRAEENVIRFCQPSKVHFTTRGRSGRLYIRDIDLQSCVTAVMAASNLNSKVDSVIDHIGRSFRSTSIWIRNEYAMVKDDVIRPAGIFYVFY